MDLTKRGLPTDSSISKKRPHWRSIIGGKQWPSTASCISFTVTDPRTQLTQATAELAPAAIVEATLVAAERGFDMWRNIPVKERANIIANAASIFRTRISHAAILLAAETGKTLPEAFSELERTAETLEWVSSRACLLSTLRKQTENGFVVQEQEPLGIALGVIPWNYPAVITARKLGAMLLAGCSVILKPSELACSSVFALAQAFYDAKLPKEVVSVVIAKGEEVIPAFLASGKISIISFTGSTHVGSMVATSAAKYFVKSVLELGGNAPAFALNDCNLAKFAEDIIAYKFEMAGQSCNAPDRIFVPRARCHELIENLISRMKTNHLLDNDPAANAIGPLRRESDVSRMELIVADARYKGARILVGGERLGKGHFFQPTIIMDPPMACMVMKEEIFGPILTVTPYEKLEDATQLANQSKYGFAAYIYGEDLDVINQLQRNLRTGYCVINHFSGVRPDLPVSGIKSSGWGNEGGDAGISEFVRWTSTRALFKIVQ